MNALGMWCSLMVFISMYGTCRVEGQASVAPTHTSTDGRDASTTGPSRTGFPNPACAVADVVFVVDGSGSIGHADFAKVKAWVIGSVEDIMTIYGPSVQIEVLQFSDKDSAYKRVPIGNSTLFQIPFHLGECIDDIECVTTKINQMPYLQSQTFTTYGLRRVSEVEFQRSKWFDISKKIVILVTDGRADDASLLASWFTSSQEIGITSYAIGVGSYNSYMWQLRTVANGNTSNDRVFTLDSFNDLEGTSPFLLDMKEEINNHTTTVCHTNATCTQAIDGVRRCSCQSGFHGNGINCSEAQITGVSTESSQTADDSSLTSIPIIPHTTEQTTAVPTEPSQTSTTDHISSTRTLSITETNSMGQTAVVATEPKQTTTEAHDFSTAVPTISPTTESNMTDDDCLKQCPGWPTSPTSRDNTAIWVCHYQKWKCTTQEWKLLVQSWWNKNNCSGIGPALDRQLTALFSCSNATEINCTCPADKKCGPDAFGCQSCVCTDGRYSDNTQLRNIWRKSLEDYQRQVEIWSKLKESCTRAVAAC